MPMTHEGWEALQEWKDSEEDYRAAWEARKLLGKATALLEDDEALLITRAVERWFEQAERRVEMARERADR